ncbi:MAG: MATE family efflux transporter [Dehalococcoidales bacterium]|nr:MATE family efflux transporter [Dehalococcoidales bacterium]
MRNLWSLSWPMLVVNTINLLGPTVDMMWVGRLGAEAIAGVGISGLVVMVVNSILFGLFTGIVAMIARFIGAKDETGANQVAQQAFVVAVGFSLLVGLVGLFFSGWILSVMGVDAAVVADGSIYLKIQLMGIVTLAAVQMCQSIMQASGDVVNPLIISVSYRLIQVGICPLLVFGWGPLPGLGISGAALSNVITQGLAAAYALWLLLGHRTRISLAFKDFRFDPGLIWRTVKIGIPASFSFAQKSIVELILISFISPFGTLAVAAQSLSQRIDQFLQNLSSGIGFAGSVLVGQNLGAGKPDQAYRTGWWAVLLSTAVSLVCMIVIWFWSIPMLSLFNDDPALLELASEFLKIQLVSYLVWGLVVSLSLAINGAGDTMMQMITNLITMLGVQVALAWYLSRYTGMGVYGVRWAIVIGILTRAVIFALYFQSGRWKRKKV